MSDENSMDVDDPNTTTLLPSLMPLPPLSLRGSQFRKLMIDVSKINHWSDLITDAGSDKEKPRFVLNFALLVCRSIVSMVTALKETFKTFSTYLDIQKLVQGLNDDKVEEWKNIVQKGDWVGMITHHMYLARF